VDAETTNDYDYPASLKLRRAGAHDNIELCSQLYLFSRATEFCAMDGAYAEAPEDSDAKKYSAIIKLTTQIYSWAAAFRRDAFSPAIRFAHKLTKKQTRLQALQQLTGFVSLLAAIRLSDCGCGND